MGRRNAATTGALTQPEAGPSRAPFNRIERLNEQLVADGRTSSTVGSSIAADKLPDDVITYYVRRLSNPDSLRGSFGWYRALDTIIAQDAQRKSLRLTMPSLAIGGAVRFGQHVSDAVTAVAVASRPWCKRATGVGSFEELPTHERTYTRGTTSIAH